MADKIVVINRGPRTFHLKPLKVKIGEDEKGESKFKETPRLLPPGGSIETLDDAEAKQLLTGYPSQIADAAKAVPHNAVKIDALKAEIARLTAENEKLTAKMADTDSGKGDAGGKGKGDKK